MKIKRVKAKKRPLLLHLLAYSSVDTAMPDLTCGGKGK